ncbi:MAG TPA: WbqC family protein, partial [Bacteroidales bacterium]|nr:WbqC family protein [Bacteroidales bacterium]
MTVLLSTAYLPPISYISGCWREEELLIERFETYPKQTSRNHCHIYGPNGRQTLSVPVIKVNGNHTLIRDIRIASTPWQRLHWRSI